MYTIRRTNKCQNEEKNIPVGCVLFVCQTCMWWSPPGDNGHSTPGYTHAMTYPSLTYPLHGHSKLPSNNTLGHNHPLDIPFPPMDIPPLRNLGPGIVTLTDTMTDNCENITFPQLLLRALISIHTDTRHVTHCCIPGGCSVRRIFTRETCCLSGIGLIRSCWTWAAGCCTIDVETSRGAGCATNRSRCK